MGLRPMPDVLSLSWANQGDHNLGYIVSIIATDAIIAKMTAMGTTVVAASGDYGQLASLIHTAEVRHCAHMCTRLHLCS